VIDTKCGILLAASSNYLKKPDVHKKILDALQYNRILVKHK
jgi:hypothetical protein